MKHNKSNCPICTDKRTPAGETKIASAPRLKRERDAAVKALIHGRNVVKALLMAIDSGTVDNLDGSEWLEFQRTATAVIYECQKGDQ